MRKVLYLINSLKNGGPVNMLYSLCKYLDNTQYKIYVMAHYTFTWWTGRLDKRSYEKWV